MTIRLFTSWYKNPARDKDNFVCLTKNLDNPLIDYIHLIIDGAEINTHPLHPKIVREYINRRLRYDDGFSIMNKYQEEDIKILANSDIYFDGTLSNLTSFMEQECYVLTRWDVKDGKAIFLNHSWSQDAWVFKGPMKDIFGAFELGHIGCDGRIAYEIVRAGYVISNPSKTIRACHIHTEPIRDEYDNHNPANAIPPPRLPVTPSYLPVSVTTHGFAENRNALVSVILPTHNRPEFLREALTSIFNQTYKNFEIIVINDCGQDVENIISEFNVNDIITYICHSQNKGASLSRNSGIKIAKGKYITYLDDDDIFYPNHLETLVAFLENSEYKIAYTDAIRVDQVLKESGEYANIVTGVYMSRDFSRESLLENNISPVHCFMLEKSCLKENLLFDEKLSAHEDWDLWIKLSKKYDFKHIKKNTVEYRHRTEGFTQISNPINLEFLKTRKIVQDRCREEKVLLQSVKPSKAMENRVVLKTRNIYKWLFEGKKYIFEKGKPVVIPPSYIAILKQKRDDNGEFLFGRTI